MIRVDGSSAVLRRVLRSIAIFAGTSVALLAVTAQFAPGWRAAGPVQPLEPQPGTSATEHDPSRDRSAPLRISVSAVTLAGAGNARAWVVLPETATTAPVPGVVLVHGAGAGDRDSLLAEARALAASGVAAITYDKRADEYSAISRDYRQLADDAIEAASMLADQAGVDGTRIGAMGWSEGGWVAPVAAQRAPERFAFLALASAPIVSPLEQVAWTADSAIAGAPDWVRRIAATALASGRIIVDYLDFDVRPALESLRVPVYAVWGADDTTVPVTVAARELLSSVAPQVTIRTLPSTGHALPVSADGWLSGAAAWMIGPLDGGDVVSGPAPAVSAGVARLPSDAWFTNPLLHAAIALALALASLLLPARSRRVGGDTPGTAPTRAIRSIRSPAPTGALPTTPGAP